MIHWREALFPKPRRLCRDLFPVTNLHGIRGLPTECDQDAGHTDLHWGSGPRYTASWEHLGGGVSHIRSIDSIGIRRTR